MGKPCSEAKKEQLRQAWRDGRYAHRDMSRAGRPKGVKDKGPRVFTAEGAKAKMENGRRLQALMLARGTIGWPKGVKPSKQHRVNNSVGVLAAIAEGRFNPRANIRKFISTSSGAERYWETRRHNGVHGLFYSEKNGMFVYYDSSWELARLLTFERAEKVESYERSPYRIPYSLNGETHYYRPDFLVTSTTGFKVLDEIKPRALCNLPAAKAKFQAARAFCRKVGIEFRLLSSLGACHVVTTPTKENQLGSFKGISSALPLVANLRK